MTIEPISWIAFGVGVAVAFIISMVWFSPLMFGKGWAAGSRLTAEDGAKMPKLAMAAHLLSLIFLAGVIAATATTSSLGAAVLAILAGAAFSVSNGAFARKTGYAMAVDGGYVVVAGIVMILAQGIF